MLRYYYINKEWMLSATAQRVYRVAAVLSLTLFFTVWVVQFPGAIPANLFPAVRVLLRLGVLGAAVTLVGMEYFLFGFDKSSESKRVFWFCVLLFPPLGPLIYYFVVYSRSAILKSTSSKPIADAWVSTRGKTPRS